MSPGAVPQRIFLDTSTFNFILEYGGCIFDGETPEENLSERSIEDIRALYNIFFVGQRASWQLAISPFTYKEIITTQSGSQRYHLERWFSDVWDYWMSVLEADDNLPSFREAEQIKINILTSGALDVLPDIEDRMLLCEAIVYRCDAFCTRDWKTILKHRKELSSLPISIITPKEWWEMIEPHTRYGV